MKLTGMQIVGLHNRMKELDGFPEVAKDVEGKSLGIILKPYDFPAGTRLALAFLADAVEQKFKALAKAEKAIVEKGDKDGQIQLLDEQIELDVKKISLASLKVDVNKLAPSLVKVLLPVLEES